MMLMFNILMTRLRKVYGLPADESSSFKARLLFFKRYQWPPFLGKKLGRSANWTERQYLELSIATELNGLGIPPERAIEIAKARYFELLKAAEVGGICEISVPPSFGTIAPRSRLLMDFSAIKAAVDETA